MARDLNVVVTNAVLSNAGDAAIALGIRQALVRSGALSDTERLTVLDMHGPEVAPSYPGIDVVHQGTRSARAGGGRVTALRNRAKPFALLIAAVLWRTSPRLITSHLRGGWSSYFRLLLRTRVVISSGGTYLVPHYDYTWRCLELLIAHTLGARVVLWTQSAGPFPKRSLKSRLLRFTLRRVDAVFCRDEVSADHFRGLIGSSSTAPQIEVVADSAFALYESGRESASNTDGVLLNVREWSVATSNQNLVYEEAFRGLADALLASGGQVYVGSTCQGQPHYSIDDMLYARRVLPTEVAPLFDGPADAVSLLDLIGDVSLVISTRMHLAIMAVIRQRPVIAVAYEFKTLELFAGINLPHQAIAYADVSATKLIDMVEATLNSPEVAVLSSEQLSFLRDSADTPARHVAGILASP